ncbi:charged multivesicular body protein 2b [Octopus sinensis]|nr:charged multivesicular body protein 2b [Octopus sinensis]
MSGIFSKKPTVQQQIRRNEQITRKTQRDLARDRTALERQEKQLEADIKKAAKEGNKQAAGILAKQLIALRKQKNKNITVGSRVQAIGSQQKMMHSSVKMADAMGTTTKTMTQMNKVMDPKKTMKMMQDFQRESTKMEMSEEMINDTLDDIFTESGDEEGEDAIVNQVLDEIGIEISGKMGEAPLPGKSSLGQASKSKVTDDEIEQQLAALKNL